MFAKDILIIDFETNSNNPRTTDPIQIGAVLLDKDTLEEKKSFESLISADMSKSDRAALEVSEIRAEDLAGAPSAAEVAQKFYNEFGINVLLSSWVEHLDRRMLIKILTEAGLDYTEYDYHYLDIWPVAYVYMLKNGFVGELDSDKGFAWFGLAKREHHDALEDCRMAAEVLRKIMDAEK